MKHGETKRGGPGKKDRRTQTRKSIGLVSHESQQWLLKSVNGSLHGLNQFKERIFIIMLYKAELRRLLRPQRVARRTPAPMGTLKDVQPVRPDRRLALIPGPKFWTLSFSSFLIFGAASFPRSHRMITRKDTLFETTASTPKRLVVVAHHEADATSKTAEKTKQSEACLPNDILDKLQTTNSAITSGCESSCG